MSEEETIPQMRERIEQLNAELKQAKDGQAQAESKARLFEAKDVFRSQGYNPVHAELYVGANPEGDITPESVDQFAGQYNLAPAEGAPEGGERSSNDSDDNADAGLAGMGRAGSGSGEGGAAAAGTEPMTHREWMDLNKRDPDAAREALRKGRVESREGNYYNTA